MLVTKQLKKLTDSVSTYSYKYCLYIFKEIILHHIISYHIMRDPQKASTHSFIYLFNIFTFIFQKSVETF